MHKICSTCGASFSPSFVYQLAVTAEGERHYFCSLECRKQRLGDEAFRARRARRIAILNQRAAPARPRPPSTSPRAWPSAGTRSCLSTPMPRATSASRSGPPATSRSTTSSSTARIRSRSPLPVRAHLDVITSNATLAAAEISLARQNPDQRARIMTQRLNRMHVSRRYDYVVGDCGPSLNLLNQNALSYADEVVIPVTCDYLALVGVKQVLRTIRDIERHLHHAVRISAVLPTFYDARTRLAREVLETLQSHFTNKCLPPIRLNTRLAEAPSHRKSIFEYAPQSNGAEDYNRVVDWVVSPAAQAQAPADTVAA